MNYYRFIHLFPETLTLQPILVKPTFRSQGFIVYIPTVCLVFKDEGGQDPIVYEEE